MRRGLALALVVVVLPGCFDGPTAGEVTLSLETPGLNDGAVSFAVSVAAPNEITGASAACPGCEVFYTRVSATELRGAVVGDLTSGPVVRLSVLDAGPNHVYRIRILEVATRAFAMRPQSGYTLIVQP